MTEHSETEPKAVFYYAHYFVHPKMMPGQTPYTREEFETVLALIESAAKVNVTEDDEIEGRV
jgi:hypothetical protein